jgi:hypothetical protein
MSLLALSGCDSRTPIADFQACLPVAAQMVDRQQFLAGGPLDSAVRHSVSEEWIDVCMLGRGWAVKKDAKPVCMHERIPLCYEEGGK